ncbi:MAG: NAD(P)-dependent glycerol-3-phosphate dehydrogenase [Deltaproteobacteria bacterium]|nr:NAD(P)-dependent glycerol-3-phosphate dehydrogenase [Deltaproteobacteria bacterium]
MRVAVIGAGAFGTSLSGCLASNGHAVRLWAREPEIVPAVNERHQNPLYLAGIPLPAEVIATDDQAEAVHGAEMVVLAAPSHATRDVAASLKSLLPPNIPIVTVAKGIENETLLTMTEVLEDVFPVERHPYLAVLSGPSFAKEVALRLPTAVTVASLWERLAREVQKAFSTDRFRVYTSTDVVGVQLGGALKNVVAIAAGCADGLGFGLNARAALITRGLAEITRAAVRRGANPMTLAGLSGLGDLVLTCTGELSRNRQLGLALGQGVKLSEALKDKRTVAEGVKTATSAVHLADKIGIELPIAREVYRILFEDKPARQAVVDLMTRELKPEF